MADLSRVSLAACQTYDLDTVQAALARLLEPLGGMGAFVHAGQRVVLKPNLVRAMTPEGAATTHPALVAAVISAVLEVGAHPIVVDSPGGPFTPGILRNLYRKTGMEWAVSTAGGELNFDVESTQVQVPDGRVIHRLDILKTIAEADAVINLGKIKTHNLTGLTLSIKNLFGVVPGTLKIAYHGKMQETPHFCQGLLDIYATVQPRLNIMDGVIGMEGNGPSGGDPRAIGALVAGDDGTAVDIASASLVDIDPLRVATIAAAIERGWTQGTLEGIELVGDDLDSLRISDFVLGANLSVDPGLLPSILRRLVRGQNDEGSESGGGRSWTSRLVTQQLLAYPSSGPKCTGCGFCARHCPVEAISIIDKRAHMDLHRCIRCYCCHELCPELAVELSYPLLARLLGRASK